VGVLALFVPALLAAMSIRLFRQPQEGHANNRIALGMLILAMTVGGIIHVANGKPSPTKAIEPVMEAGGILGFIVGTPLAGLLTDGLAIAVLVLLTLLGVLIVVGKPLREVIGYIAAFVGRFRTRGGEHEGDELDLPEHRTLERRG